MDVLVEGPGLVDGILSGYWTYFDVFFMKGNIVFLYFVSYHLKERFLHCSTETGTFEVLYCRREQSTNGHSV